MLHYPVNNKNKEIVASSVTNFDIHDISRCARTYGINKYFIVHPQKSQRDFTSRLISFWQDGYGREYNSDRSTAVDIVEIVADLKEIEDKYGNHILIATTAQDKPMGIDIDKLVQGNGFKPGIKLSYFIWNWLGYSRRSIRFVRLYFKTSFRIRGIQSFICKKCSCNYY